MDGETATAPSLFMSCIITDCIPTLTAMDFRRFYNSEEHSDVKIVLNWSHNSATGRKLRKRARESGPEEEHLQGHALILTNCSDKFRYCKAWLYLWLDDE